MFVMISKQLNGASLEASAYLRDNINNKWPIQANIPIVAIINHWSKLGLTHTKGTIVDMMMAPTTPVNNKVNNGLSQELRLRVIIK